LTTFSSRTELCAISRIPVAAIEPVGGCCLMHDWCDAKLIQVYPKTQ